jgi:hypothetical protein
MENLDKPKCSSLDHCVSSAMSRSENGAYDRTESESEFLC